MPGVASDSGDGPVVPVSSENRQPVTVYSLKHGLSPPLARASISWSRGNSLRISIFRPPFAGDSAESDCDAGGKVLEVKLSNVDPEISDAQWRRIAYGSVSPFAHLQSRRNAFSGIYKGLMSPSPHQIDWWEYAVEYSKEISSLLSGPKCLPSPIIEDPKSLLRKVEEPTCLKAAWELIEIFYVEKQSQAWLPERLVDWLAIYDGLLSITQPTIHSNLVDFQKELVGLQVIEENLKYWEVMSSALAIGWLDVVVKMLRLHGSYQLVQLSNRETENGLVEAVAVLISRMPRLCSQLDDGKLGECFSSKPDFVKAWEKWRAQITKLESSAFWIRCNNRLTRDGLKNMLQIMLGNPDSLSMATCNWIELFISHFLYIRPFTMGLESMRALAQKCMQSKPMASTHRLMGLMIGILEENSEVVLAECSKEFGPWMVAHAIELLTVGSEEAEILLHEEQAILGGISICELHRLVYAQVLSSHSLTWQIAPIYLSSCMKQGMGLLENLLYRQSVQQNHLVLKNLEICRLNELDHVSSNIMKVAGVYHWKHGRKGCGVFWLQKARDAGRLNRIAQQLFDSVGKSISDESFEQWEGVIELLGSDSKTTGGLEFLHKYRDFKMMLQYVCDGKSIDAAQQAAEFLVLLMKNPATPQRFWLPLLFDSLQLLNWKEKPILSVAQTNLLLNKLQELSMTKLRPDFIEASLPPHALSTIRQALATNLGRAILEE